MTPTEAEIREAVAFEMLEQITDRVGDVVYAAAIPLRELWNPDDFRASETADWDRIMGKVYARADETFVALLVDELTRAGVEFAKAHPDAPRAVREPVTA